MLVKELIEQLSKLDPEMEVTLNRPGSAYGPGYSTSRIKVVNGYLVRDESGFYSKLEGNGVFVDSKMAECVMPDGRKYLDLTSPTIHPAIQIELPRY